jgi:hypothetical protein
MKPQKKYIVLIAVLSMLGALASTAGASMILGNTATWAVDNSQDGVGTGILSGVTLNYTTLSGHANSGVSYQNVNWWNVGAGTAAECNTCYDQSATPNFPSAAMIGANAGTPQTDTITFTGGQIVNPIIFMDWGNPGTTMDFGSLTLVMLSSNNASLSGSVVTFGAGATNSINDGFSAEILGTFGPSQSLSFIATAQPTIYGTFDGVAVTLGDVPEPASLGLGLVGIVGLCLYRRRVAR